MIPSPAPAPLLQNALRFLDAGDADAARLLVDTHLAKAPDEPEAFNILGLIAQRQRDLSAAAQAFARAVDLAPAEILYTIHYAQALTDLGDASQALSILESGLQRKPGHCDALIARALILQRAGRLDEAVAGARMATVFHRESARAFQTLGTLLLKARQPQDAIQALSRAVEIDSTAVDGWVNLGVAQRDVGHFEAAEASYRRALALAPNDPIAHNNLGNALSSLSRHAEAVDAYRAAIALKPDYAEAKANLANALRDVGDLDAALAGLKTAVAAHLDHAGVLSAYGNLLRIAEKFDDAITVLRKAAVLSSQSAEIHNNLGLALSLKNKWDEAEGHFRTATLLKPDQPIISNNHGALLLRMFKFDEAVAALSNAIAHDPDYDEAYCNLGVAHYMLGQANEAIDVYRRVVARSPKNAFARYGLAVTLLEDQRLSEAEAEVREAIALDPHNAMAQNTLGVLLLDQHFISAARQAMKEAADEHTISAPIFYSNYAFASLYEPDITNAQVFEIHKEYGNRYAKPVVERSRPHTQARSPDRKLTLAYMSPDFRAHSVAYFFEPLMEKHDRSKFRIVLYSNTSRKDNVTEGLRRVADEWVETLGLTDDKFAEKIREDKIDILVNLGGHTSGNRLPVCARNAAPVQIEYLGYPETSGVPAMGYRISDERADPSGIADAMCTEKLVRLPDCFHCYRPHGRAPEPAPAPHLTKGFVTFASFNVLPKVNDRTIAAWSAILKGVPNARFYMKCKQLRDPKVQARIRDDFARHGIDPARIDMESFVPSVQDHLAQYAQVDLALDTFPYNGTTTTCEAIWMGVPVLTMAGDNHRSRVGYSLLTALGMADQFVAHDVDDYIARAIAWGKNAQPLAELRTGLRPRMAASPLCDEVGFTRTLEKAYRDMWQDWCAGPDTFEFKAPPELRPEDSIQGVMVKTL
ncbi:MAG: tetratricopeptide repeat protein [Rhodospirillaceae bacterium]|nr:tetratricopeptide repeat protein [Rhodospirillaceae bacterium]